MNLYASYLCNFHCRFCSIRQDESPMLDLAWVREELAAHPELCSNINILGGEPSVLPLPYQEELIDICTRAADEKPYYITNLFKMSPLLEKCRPIVSYDFSLREHHQTVFQNMLNLEIDFSISTVLTRHLVEEVGAKKYLRLIRSLKNCKRADLDLYYKGKQDKEDHTPDNASLIAFVKEIMIEEKVNLAPLSAMRHHIDASFDNISDYFAFMPGNKYGVRLDYENGPYKIFDTYDEAYGYFKRRIENSRCKSCEFLDTCWYPCSDDICRGNRPMLEEFKKYVLSSRG